MYREEHLHTLIYLILVMCTTPYVLRCVLFCSYEIKIKPLYIDILLFQTMNSKDE